MALSLNDKKAIVAELLQLAERSISAIVVDYRGVTVNEMSGLRAEARKNGVTIRVYRNTLARRAIDGTKFECLKEVLVGPVALLFSTEEPGAAARLLRNYLKTSQAMEVKALSMGGALLAANQLEAVASLPSREEALAKLMSVIRAPVTQFVRTLKEPVAQFVRVVAAIRDQKKAA